jgi:hypothetical protein
MSSSRVSILNFDKSGLKVTQVKSYFPYKLEKIMLKLCKKIILKNNDYCEFFYDRSRTRTHVIPPDHFETFLLSFIGSFQLKMLTKNIGQLGSVPIPSSSHFLLFIIIIASSQQMSENELRHINFVFLMNLNRNAFPIVPHRNLIGLFVNFN